MDAKQFNAGTITVQFSTSPHNSSYGCECTTPTAGTAYAVVIEVTATDW